MTTDLATYQANTHTARKQSLPIDQSASQAWLPTLLNNVKFGSLSDNYQNTTTGSSSMILGLSAQAAAREQTFLPPRTHQHNKELLLFIKSKIQRKRSMEETPLKRQKCDSTLDQSKTSSKLVESRSIQETRLRMFSHSPVELAAFNKELIKAGFFSCNVGDRTICIYCDLICQQWDKKSDDPSEVHRAFSPRCAYVASKLTPGSTALSEMNDETGSSSESGSSLLAITTVDTVTPNNGQPRTMPNVRRANNLGNLDENLLTRLVAARLDLPASQRMLTAGFKLSIVKRVWEDQLRLKGDDFASDTDLYTACLILRKQIEHINGDKNKIVIPRIRLTLLRDAENNTDASQLPPLHPRSIVETPISAQEPVNPVVTPLATTTAEKPKDTETSNQLPKETKVESSLDHPCLVCEKEEKQLACIPCGHLVACVHCSQSLRTCPVCRREIEAYVRIYL